MPEGAGSLTTPPCVSSLTPPAAQLRPPRIVRVGLIQNKIVLPTTAPVLDQLTALHKLIGGIIEAAAAGRVNVVCMQEAWSKGSASLWCWCGGLMVRVHSNALCLLHAREGALA